MHCFSNSASRMILAISVALICVFANSTASALEGYSDRNGMYWGVAGHAGWAHFDIDSDNGESTFEGRRPIGGLSVELGQGIDESTLLGGEIGVLYGEGETESGLDIGHSHTRFMAKVNYFATDHFYLIGGAGVVFGNFELDAGDYERSESEMGLGAKAGLGYEAFVNGTGAIGGSLTFHYYGESGAVLDAPVLGIHYRWH